MDIDQRRHVISCAVAYYCFQYNCVCERSVYLGLHAGMLILVLVLKNSLRTFSSPCPGPWESGPCPRPGPWVSGPCPCSGPCGSGPFSYSAPCGLVFVPVLVFSSCKDLFPLFQYSDFFAYYYIVVGLSMHAISFNYTYLCLFFRHIALRLYVVYGLATFFCHYNHRYYKAYNIYGYNTSLVFHLESSIENVK